MVSITNFLDLNSSNPIELRDVAEAFEEYLNGKEDEKKCGRTFRQRKNDSLISYGIRYDFTEFTVGLFWSDLLRLLPEDGSLFRECQNVCVNIMNNIEFGEEDIYGVGECEVFKDKLFKAAGEEVGIDILELFKKSKMKREEKRK